MEVTIKEHSVVAERSGDRKFYSDSTLLHHVKLEIIKQGHDVIKKRMWKDGHMVDDTQQYIRSRKHSNQDAFMVWDTQYAIRFAYEDFNNGALVLSKDNINN